MSKQFQVFDVGGDVFTLSVTIADAKVLQSKYFAPEEALFLKETIRNKKIDVVTGMNLQIYLRTVYDPVTMSSAKLFESGEVPMSQVVRARKSTRFVMFLPGWRLDENLTTSWCWMKFATHLVKNNFNCIFIDLPGFSKSTVGSMSRCSPERWAKFDVDIVRVILETLKIPRCHLVSWGDSAAIVLNCMKKIPKMLAVRHVMLAPIVDTKVFTVEVVAKLLLQTSTTLFLAHDPKTYGDKSREVIMFKVSDTLAMFREIAEKSALLAHQINIGVLTANDLQRVILSESPDPGLPSVCGLVPSKYFTIFCEEFLIGTMVGTYNSQNLQGRLEFLERLKVHMKTQQEKMAHLEEGGLTGTQAEALKKMQEQTEDDLGAATMMRQNRRESRFEKYQRLSHWKLKKTVPEYSFGVRVLERNLVDETETALATSLDEYLDTFGAEEDEFLRACDESANTLKKEQKDERLLELRSRVEVDPMEQLANWQKAAEDSYHQFQLEQRTGFEDVQHAVAMSKREVDLTSMLQEEDRRTRPNNAPSAAIDIGTLYQPAPQLRWQQAQQRELAEKRAEDARAAQQQRKVPDASAVRDGADEAIRRAMLESEQLEKRMGFVDRFSARSQPQDLDDEELLSLAREKSKKHTSGPGTESPPALSPSASVARLSSGGAGPDAEESSDAEDDDIPRAGSHRLAPQSSSSRGPASVSRGISGKSKGRDDQPKIYDVDKLGETLQSQKSGGPPGKRRSNMRGWDVDVPGKAGATSSSSTKLSASASSNRKSAASSFSGPQPADLRGAGAPHMHPDAPDEPVISAKMFTSSSTASASSSSSDGISSLPHRETDDENPSSSAAYFSSRLADLEEASRELIDESFVNLESAGASSASAVSSATSSSSSSSSSCAPSRSSLSPIDENGPGGLTREVGGQEPGNHFRLQPVAGLQLDEAQPVAEPLLDEHGNATDKARKGRKRKKTVRIHPSAMDHKTKSQSTHYEVLQHTSTLAKASQDARGGQTLEAKVSRRKTVPGGEDHGTREEAVMKKSASGGLLAWMMPRWFGTRR